MKLTKEHLKKIIKEELEATLSRREFVLAASKLGNFLQGLGLPGDTEIINKYLQDILRRRPHDPPRLPKEMNKDHPDYGRTSPEWVSQLVFNVYNASGNTPGGNVYMGRQQEETKPLAQQIADNINSRRSD